MARRGVAGSTEPQLHNMSCPASQVAWPGPTYKLALLQFELLEVTGSVSGAKGGQVGCHGWVSRHAEKLQRGERAWCQPACQPHTHTCTLESHEGKTISSTQAASIATLNDCKAFGLSFCCPTLGKDHSQHACVWAMMLMKKARADLGC